MLLTLIPILVAALVAIRRQRARLQAMEMHQLQEENYWQIKCDNWPNRYSRELARRGI
jgi:hypothetical protein